ncbi:beta-lactamase family protein [Parvularcula flava]|uniref:Beta-lactamase family protein n=1 Tax=Aquisalinus luteolus TaxID=1566827 RepID=A0A8J3ERV8_9PROT|nr:serine hydrolase domain-containing protein [Aquisalinus luteolus]NHK28594.1 beta-lactamase family protein [Aquisalinus luteolus]GGH98946.1 hypothetical protein GCM10011355_23740 [Aquisalinus luteolus]
MAALLNGFSVPGASMALIKDCQVSDLAAYGTANLETSAAVTDTTLFEAASLSKPVLAWITVALADEGVIDLDESIAEKMDWPRIADKDAYAQITPRMVLTHRTGLPNWSGASLDWDREDPLDFLAEPGTQPTYSGEAIQILQAWVEQETGKTLQALFKERLGETMPHSSFTVPFPEGTSVSMGYQSSTEPDSARKMHHPDRAQAAGGLLTTAEDYAAFMAKVCRREGMSEAAYEEMLSPQTEVIEGDSGAPTAFGLGFAILYVPGDTIIGHDGNNDEYRTAAFISPQYREGLVYFSNGARGADLFNTMMGQ